MSKSMQQYIMIHKTTFTRWRMLMLYNLQHTFRDNRLKDFIFLLIFVPLFVVIYIIFLEVTNLTSLILKIFMLGKLYNFLRSYKSNICNP